MIGPLNDPGRRGLVANLVVWLGLVLGLNGVVSGLGWNTRSTAPDRWFAPPGWVTGPVWVGLFTLLATAR
jgi:tryptophan-rich sensory protein